ncbi:hypothetical protein [Acidiphilium sp.]|uniref:hypothetical protein n=1 Tax=Acidiphilium sp. TaxID=527 RepID=UPI003D056E83
MDIETPPPPTMAAVLRSMVAHRQERIAVLEDALAARDAIIAARDHAIAEQAALIAALRLTVEQREQLIARLEPEAARCAQLALTLTWPDGPRALRAVLPVARLIRRIMRR